MSQGAVRNGTVKAQAGQDDEICPVCKSNRYLNPNMRFLVNPECYHKMCESCVDRIFSQGPAPCPVAGCARTLRKQRFRKQTFEDLQIEREVDIRRRIAGVFNRRQDEFMDLLAYNNYLEEVETMTFNLIYNIDVPTTEAKLAAYASQNAPVIAANANLSSRELNAMEAARTAQDEQAKLRRQVAKQEQIDEAQEKAEARREIQDRLANATSAEDPDTVVKETNRVILKKSTARRNAGTSTTTAANKQQHQQQQQQQQQQTQSSNNSNAPLTDPSIFQIKGLKPVMMPEIEKPYDPFGGLEMQWAYHSSTKTDWEHPWLEKAKTNTDIITGGYDVREYCARAMVEAFEGFGVFVEEEIGQRNQAADKGVATMAAAAAAADAGTGAGAGMGTENVKADNGKNIDDGDDVF